MSIEFKKLAPNAIIPVRKTEGAAGYDLYALEDTKVFPLQVYVVRTGIAVQMPKGTYGRIAIRSSIAKNYNANVTAGVIDEDYRNEIMVMLYLFDKNQLLNIRAGDRFAQLIPEVIWHGGASEVTEFSRDATDRTGGFGSTGTK